MKKNLLYKFSSKIHVCIGGRFGCIVLFFASYLGIGFFTRLMLLIKSAQDISWNFSLLAAFGWGVVYDLGAACWFSLPLIIILCVLPRRFSEWRWGRLLAYVMMFVVLYILLFGIVAEWVFWDEFGVRFNFIAVDYLVYTQEVINNILQSYPVPMLLGCLALLAIILYSIFWYTGMPQYWLDRAAEPARRRFISGGVWCVVVVAAGLTINQNWLPDFANNYNRELGKNGVWSLFAAFKDNQLEFNRFFPTISVDRAFKIMHTELVEDGSVLLLPGEKDNLRFYDKKGPELTPNVIQITVESLSAKFVNGTGPYANLTPNLDALETNSLVFDNFYATGTRTVRGMEALALSLPPTPGRSLLKRPHNEGLFTLGALFREKGYDTAFIYSGFGYFDNMNYFFANNGYRVIDRNSVSSDDVTFANVWGACDEDLYRWTIREADAVAETGKPFYFFLMTTSNHRPFSFPGGKIDLPSKTSKRRGGIKYTDYAIGEFLKTAGAKSWFNNTIFVIVADHCASSSGKTELPVENYHIPLIIYAPGGQIKPGHIKTIASQIDYGPTLLGLLNWSYPSRFMGHDVRTISPEEGHAIIGNYQKLGHIEEGEFVILKPVRENVEYHYDFVSGKMNRTPLEKESDEETISYYEVASYLYTHGLYKALSADEFRLYMNMGRTLAKHSMM